MAAVQQTEQRENRGPIPWRAVLSTVTAFLAACAWVDPEEVGDGRANVFVFERFAKSPGDSATQRRQVFRPRTLWFLLFFLCTVAILGGLYAEGFSRRHECTCLGEAGRQATAFRLRPRIALSHLSSWRSGGGSASEIPWWARASNSTSSRAKREKHSSKVSVSVFGCDSDDLNEATTQQRLALSWARICGRQARIAAAAQLRSRLDAPVAFSTSHECRTFLQASGIHGYLSLGCTWAFSRSRTRLVLGDRKGFQ